MVALSALLSGCSSSTSADDAGSVLDSSRAADAGGTPGEAPTQPDGGVPADAGSAALVPSLASAKQSYLTWKRHSEMPQGISSEIFSLCRSPSHPETAFVASVHGDKLYLLDWLNDAAVRGSATMASSAFPVGAALVKEKLTLKPDGKFELSALGLMIKHEPGFDPAHGDWEFGYWAASQGPSTAPERATECAGCHAASKTDFVYLDQSWRKR